MAWRIDAFRPVDEYLAEMDAMLAALRAAAPVEGEERVYIPGDLEEIAAADRRAHGIPVHPKVIAELRELGAELGVPVPF
jgi:LDH2 family malate/lactate/ureidoglycolate dehydrogenase